jgi:hypothetical protein
MISLQLLILFITLPVNLDTWYDGSCSSRSAMLRWSHTHLFPSSLCFSSIFNIPCIISVCVTKIKCFKSMIRQLSLNRNNGCNYDTWFLMFDWWAGWLLFNAKSTIFHLYPANNQDWLAQSTIKVNLLLKVLLKLIVNYFFCTNVN